MPYWLPRGQQVPHQMWIWGIHEQTSFETRDRCHQKSKTGISVAPQIGLMSSKNLKDKIK